MTANIDQNCVLYMLSNRNDSLLLIKQYKVKLIRLLIQSGIHDHDIAIVVLPLTIVYNYNYACPIIKRKKK